MASYVSDACLKPILGWRQGWHCVMTPTVTPKARHLTLLTLLGESEELSSAILDAIDWLDLLDGGETEMEAKEAQVQQGSLPLKESPRMNIFHIDPGTQEFIDKLREADIEQKLHLPRKLANIDLDLSNNDTEKESRKFLHTLQKVTEALEKSRDNLLELSKQCDKYRQVTIQWEKSNKDPTFNAPCTIETKQVRVVQGEPVRVRDVNTPNELQVESAGGRGNIPALAYLLPSADRCVLSAVTRINLQLVANWSHAVNKLGKQLLNYLSSTLKAWSSEKMRILQNATNGVGQSTLLSAEQLHTALASAQLSHYHIDSLLNGIHKMQASLKDHAENNTPKNVKEGAVLTLKKITDEIDLLLQIVKSYKDLKDSHDNLKATLIKQFPRFTFVDDIRDLQTGREGRRYRCYEVKTTVENVETVENITYSKPRGVTEMSSKSERVETDQITSSSSEERRKFIIRAVIDPVTQTEISFKEAISRGIIDQSSGMYIDSKNKTSIPIPVAMNRNLILVDFTTASKSKEEKKSIGLITIKTKSESKPYKITSVRDTRNDIALTPEDATAKGILDEGSGTLLNTKSGKVMTLTDAMVEGLLTMEENTDEAPEVVKTYAVHSVVDPIKRQKVNFSEAVKRGLLEPHTGNYRNTLTGETIYVGDAIKRGFLKAKIVTDTASLNIDAENKMVIERVDHIKKKILRPMGIISAMKRISKVDISQK